MPGIWRAAIVRVGNFDYAVIHLARSKLPLGDLIERIGVIAEIVCPTDAPIDRNTVAENFAP
jgi:hypothetical protein